MSVSPRQSDTQRPSPQSVSNSAASFVIEEFPQEVAQICNDWLAICRDMGEGPWNQRLADVAQALIGTVDRGSQ